MEQKIKKFLEDMIIVLNDGGEDYYVKLVDNALNNEQDKLWNFLVSNELWGGAGSIADQALLSKKTLRFKLEKLLVELGSVQMSINKTNVRTEMWISAFRKNEKLEGSDLET